MQRRIGLLLGLFLASGAAGAFAQVDCGAGGALCTTAKYGLGLAPDFRKDEIPPDPFRYTNDFFGPDLGGVSYFSSRSDLTGSFGICGPQRLHRPLPGQMLLREQTDCAPTSTGPTCTAGERIGAPCHLPTLSGGCSGAGVPLPCCSGPGEGTCLGFQPSASNALECGAAGTCELGPGVGCRVEIPPSNGGVTPAGDTSEVYLFSYSAFVSNGRTLNVSAQTGYTLGGTSDDLFSLCTDSNVRRRPTTGTRYLLQASRGGDAAKTYVRWDSAAGIPSGELDDFATSFRFHADDSWSCCAPMDACRASFPCIFPAVFPPPPIPSFCSSLTNPVWQSRNCWWSGPLVNEDNVQADLIFAGGRGSAFYTDPEFMLPGQIAGICRRNRDVACFIAGANAECTALRVPYSCCGGAGTGTCTEDCSGLDADPSAAGLQPDECDLSTPGYRIQGLCGRTAGNDSRPECCGTAILVLRGAPERGCSILPRPAYIGDPGPDCALPNYGIDHRDDDDCDGIADLPDLCPFYSEWDQALDSDGDCNGGPGSACRGDECECGDQTSDGVVNVSDLVVINQAIFGSAVRKQLCDTSNDSLCNVSDIVGAHREIIDPDSSQCRQITPRRCLVGIPAPCCGNTVLEPGELCDDGNLAGGDGCNAACRPE